MKIYANIIDKVCQVLRSSLKDKEKLTLIREIVEPNSNTAEGFELLVQEASKAFRTYPEVVLSDKRYTDASHARHSIAKVLSEKMGTKDIAGLLNRDQTTIQHSLRVFKDLYETDKDFRAKYHKLISKL